ncbi:MAG: GTPase HflX [Bdellovibrio sp.]|nr:MAG: GTPase HflX [Bdellovibrio sp.]
MLHATNNCPEKVIVVGVGLKSDPLHEIRENLIELEELVHSAGGEVVGSVIQILKKYQPHTLIGSGKVQELFHMVQDSHCSLVVIDHQLSGSQAKNLNEALKCKVIDRSQLILDIFAQRAQTYEGKLQVELAQMLDQLPRMVGGWLGSLSRQAGGIGTRGPGETALERDRRRIHERIKQIKKKLETVKKNRHQHRMKRQKNRIPSFALIGYTNAGKSSLLNKLTQSHVYAKDQLFATLDPTTRQIFLPEVGNCVITDTVGFIHKLPTQLIEAFKATLEESSNADILIHVMDLSNPHLEKQKRVVDQLIDELGWGSKPLIHVYNKVDAAPFEKQLHIETFPRVFTSALTGRGLEQLKKLMTEEVQKLKQDVELFFSQEEAHKIFELSRITPILKKEESPSGILCHVQLSPTQMSQWKKYRL